MLKKESSLMHIAIIGCGKMGTALAELLGPSHQLLLYDRDWNWTQQLAQKVNGSPFQQLSEVLTKAQFIFLAVKPQNLKEIAPLMNPSLRKGQIIISLLAGTPLDILKHYFTQPVLVRIMPNLAMRYGAGVVGIVDTPDLSPELKQELQKLLTPLGLIYWLKENQMDALTALTGSGPAFILTLIEAMVETGVAMGFQAENAEHLIIQMLQGCITLLQKTGQHPAELKWQIASPNGTTIAGLRVLERENVRSGLMETFLATYQRAQELAKEHDKASMKTI
jgi:pyrroline-5-carboxylate reductase